MHFSIGRIDSRSLMLYLNVQKYISPKKQMKFFSNAFAHLFHKENKVKGNPINSKKV